MSDTLLTISLVICMIIQRRIKRCRYFSIPDPRLTFLLFANIGRVGLEDGLKCGERDHQHGDTSLEMLPE